MMIDDDRGNRIVYSGLGGHEPNTIQYNSITSTEENGISPSTERHQVIDSILHTIEQWQSVIAWEYEQSETAMTSRISTMKQDYKVE